VERTAAILVEAITVGAWADVASLRNSRSPSDLRRLSRHHGVNPELGARWEFFVEDHVLQDNARMRGESAEACSWEQREKIAVSRRR
jgi:hypothetical protein